MKISFCIDEILSIKFITAIIILFLSFVQAWTPLHAAILFVDAQVGEPGCDLVEAINSANNDESEGGCVSIDPYGDDRIVILLDEIVLEQAYEVESQNAFPEINSKISIIGSPDGSLTGSTDGSLTRIVRSESPATPNFNFFNVTINGDLTLQHLELFNGNVGRSESGFLFSSDAINISGQATLNNVSVRNNGGGRSTITVSGTELFPATLRIEKSSFYRNSPLEDGRGVIGLGNNSKLDVFDSTFSANQGTAIANYTLGGSMSVSLINTTIVNNTGGYSGGLKLNIARSTSDEKRSITVRNSIISGNRNRINTAFFAEMFFSDQFGGEGVSTATPILDNNVIGESTLTTEEAIGYNIALDNSNQLATSDGGTPIALNQIVSSAVSPLGRTTYHPLASNSPAIDTGIQFRLVTSLFNLVLPGCRGESIIGGSEPEAYRRDQIGSERPLDAECDIGAIEYQEMDEQCYVVPVKNGSTVVFCL